MALLGGQKCDLRTCSSGENFGGKISDIFFLEIWPKIHNFEHLIRNLSYMRISKGYFPGVTVISAWSVVGWRLWPPTGVRLPQGHRSTRGREALHAFNQNPLGEVVWRTVKLYTSRDREQRLEDAALCLFQFV